MSRLIEIAANRCIRLIASALVLVTLASQGAHAQTPPQNESGIRGFVNAVGSTIYGLAWPTATYEEISVASVRPVPGGFDVVVRLSGESVFGGALWLKLGLEFRQDGLHDMRVIEHNAILAPPFSTVGAIAKALDEAGKSYERGGHAAAGAEAVCVANPTSQPIRFSYRWGRDGEWSSYELGANKQGWFGWPLSDGPSPDFFIRYDDSFSDGYSGQSYRLERNRVSLPATCQSANRYMFDTRGASIVLLAVR